MKRLASGEMVADPLESPERVIVGWNGEGVCDRVTAMLLLHAISQRTSRRAQWHWSPNELCACHFERLFECKHISVSDQCIENPGVFIVNGNTPGEAVIRRAMELHAESALLLHSYYFGHSYDDMDLVLGPSHEVREAFEEFMKNEWHSVMLGVHVRRGDKRSLGPAPIETYFNVIDSILDRSPECGVFVATDDPDEERRFRRQYGLRFVAYPVRDYGRKRPEAIIDAVIVLYLLRNTQGVVGGKFSGYSLCAGWERGFQDVPAQQNQNHSWAGGEITLKPLRIGGAPIV